MVIFWQVGARGAHGISRALRDRPPADGDIPRASRACSRRAARAGGRGRSRWRSSSGSAASFSSTSRRSASRSLLPSGAASRALILSVLVNPVDAVRTGALLGIEGTTAFGAASLALLRFTRGPAGAALALAASVLFWLVAPVLLALRRISRADL